MSGRPLLAAAALAVLVAGTWLGTGRQHDAPAAAAERYQCSMHPQIVSDEPGTCPICGMRLTPVEDTPAAAPAKPLFYRHPMRPDVTSPTPAKDEMGMDYVPVYPGDVSEAHGEVPGRAPFELSSERQQLIGVTRGRVEERDLVAEIRTVGRVAYDPELYNAIVEYREAVESRTKLQGDAWPEATRGADALIRAAALRLRQRGVGEDQLRVLTRDPQNLLLPDKSAWIYAQVYESEMDLVRPGQEIVVTAPGRTYTTQVAAVDPILNVATRTARVRALVPTPDGSLRPETFVNVVIRVPLGRRLTVPKDAVLDSGARQIAFVVQGEGRFEPRAVTLGRRAGDLAEVLSGLTAGEEVVTSANFLIDSESRFRAAVAAFGKTQPPHQH